jgi:hypothetical protein
MPRPIVLAAGAVAALSALAATFPAVEAQPAQAPNACFNLNDMRGSRVPDNRNMYFRTGTGRVYHIEFGSDCPNAMNYVLILHPFDNNAQDICRAVELDVRVRDTGAICIPKSLSVLSPAEAAALPPNARP